MACELSFRNRYGNWCVVDRVSEIERANNPRHSQTRSIWLIYFVTSTEEVVVRTFNPYVTSAFELHSLTAATGIMASIIGGLSKLPLAKLLDTWGRPQGLALALLIWVLGFIMMATCKNVQTYAAAQVFSTVG